MKSFSTPIEAITHIGGPQFNGEHKTRCCVSNVKEVTFLSSGYLRSHNFYPLDIANIIAKYLINHHLIINFKQSSEFVNMKIAGVNYLEGKQRCTVLFTPNIKQLQFIRDDIEDDNKMKHDSYNQDKKGIIDECNKDNIKLDSETYHINFDFKLLYHSCDVKTQSWYSNNGYMIQCGIIKVPKKNISTSINPDAYDDDNNELSNSTMSSDEAFVNRFISIDAKKLGEFKGEVELGNLTKMVKRESNEDANGSDIETYYTFLALYSQANYYYASFGINERYESTALFYLQNEKDGSSYENGGRYALKTNDSITVSIIRETVEKSKEEKKLESGDIESINEKNEYKYSVCWMKNCDKNQVYEDEDEPYVVQLDCDKNNYFVVMSSVPCSCNTRGFEYEVNVS